MLLLRLVAVLVTLPWAIVVALLRVVVALVRFPAAFRAKRAEFLLCPSGHRNQVFGRWTCGCGAAYLGHAFGPCPVCGMPAGWVRCEVCGLALRSPWKDS